MPVDLYYYPGSSPCRAVRMALKAFGVEATLHLVDIMNNEQFADEFLALNPMHTVPTLVDDGLVLIESKAILMYLADKYGKPDDPLYPRDLQRRAVVNQRLLFDEGSLYNSFADYYYPRFFEGATSFVDEDLKQIEKTLALLDTYIGANWFAAGDTFTIADIALVATISSFVHPDGGYRLGKDYPNVTKWFHKCKAVAPGYDLNVAGLREFKQLFALLKA